MFTVTNGYKEKILNCFDGKTFASGTGKTKAETEKAVEKILAENVERGIAYVKTEAEAYVFENTQFAMFDWDIFASELDANCVIDRVRTPYIAEVDNEMPDKEVYRTLRRVSLYWGGYDFGHVMLDYERVFKLGIAGIRNEALKRLGTAKPEHKEYYSNVAKIYNSLSVLLMRMSAYAESLKGENMQLLGTSLSNLAKYPPKTLHEALQLHLLLYRLTTEVERHYIRSLGQIDLLWKPFYENDLKNGKSEKELDAYIQAFFLRLEGMRITANVPVALGGLDENGKEIFDDFTEKLFDLYAELNIISPKIHIKYTENTPQRFCEKAAKNIINGNSSILFINDKVVRNGLKKIGIEEKYTYDYSVIGCYEPVASKVEIRPTCPAQISLSKILEVTLCDGYDRFSNTRLGIKSGKLEEIGTFEDLLDRFYKQLAYCAEKAEEYTAYYEKNYPRYTVAPIYSGAEEPSMEKGVDVYAGGMLYNNSGLNVFGIATVVDSLLSIKRFVFDTKEYALKDFVEIVNSDWQANEKLRLRAKNLKDKYGNNDKIADGLMLEIYNECAKNINGKPNGMGGKFVMGYFSIDNYMKSAKSLLASADGRRNFDFISKNLCASQGSDMKGLTSLINSVAKLDFTDSANGSVLDIIVHPSVVSGEDGASVFWSVCKTYLDNGGFAIHGNVFDYKVLEEAQKNPEKYKSLQVRVCGWNSYFLTLSKEEQQTFIDNAKRSV